MENSGVTFPQGFLAAGISAGIKKSGKPDFAIVFSEFPATVAAVYTTNKVKAAPVVRDKQITDNGGKIKAIVINSGNANACTGEQGTIDAQKTAVLVAKELSCLPEEVLTCSTGVIGVTLPMENIEIGVNIASRHIKSILGADCTERSEMTARGGVDASRAIMTTDTFYKISTAEQDGIKIGGMTKGSGMIHPNMATMLAFVTTDVKAEKEIFQKALNEVVDKTFNMITVDGDTSTNDTLMLLANGASGIELTEENYSSFVKILLEVCTKLAKDVAKDGEGATKLIEVSVFGAASLKDARILARSVAASNLFKAAMFGADANWGRALCAMGYSGAQFNPDNVNMNFAAYVTDEHGDVFDESLPVMENGTPVEFSEELAKRILSQKEIIVKIFLKDGENSATAWGCDLTYDYVKINGDYRS